MLDYINKVWGYSYYKLSMYVVSDGQYGVHILSSMNFLQYLCEGSRPLLQRLYDKTVAFKSGAASKEPVSID
jgi:hypothetical protein